MPPRFLACAICIVSFNPYKSIMMIVFQSFRKLIQNVPSHCPWSHSLSMAEPQCTRVCLNLESVLQQWVGRSYITQFSRKIVGDPRSRPRLGVDFDFEGNLASRAKAIYSAKQNETLPPFNYHSLSLFWGWGWGDLSESVTVLGILVSLQCGNEKLSVHTGLFPTTVLIGRVEIMILISQGYFEDQLSVCRVFGVPSKQSTHSSQTSPQVHGRAAVCWMISCCQEGHALGEAEAWKAPWSSLLSLIQLLLLLSCITQSFLGYLLQIGHWRYKGV